MTFLNDIAAITQRQVRSGYYNEVPQSPVLVSKASLKKQLKKDFTVIAEIKPKSPTHGTLYEGDAGELAETYKQNGAGALSVLCEPIRFGGSLENLAKAKKTGLPVLAKDFVLTVQQLDAYRAYGADAVLLIHELFEAKKTEGTLEEFIVAAHDQGLDVVLEVHTEQALRDALKTKADVIGINNRDLHQMTINTLHYQNLLAHVDVDRPVIAESGFTGKDDVDVAKKRVNGVLIGTGLLKGGDPGKKLRELV